MTVINQLVSRSAFYVELSSDWYVIVIYDFPKLQNSLILLRLETPHQDVVVREFEFPSGNCQGVLFPPERGIPY